MITVGTLAQQILSLDPKKSPARLAFYHFLKNFLPFNSTFSQDMLDSFYDRALGYQYWQVNKNLLGEVVKADLEAVSSRHQFAFDLSSVMHSSQFQFLCLEHKRDFLSLLEKEIKQRTQNGEKIRSFQWSDQEIILVCLKPDGTLTAEVKGGIAVLLEGQLHLVRPHSILTYNHELEFHEEYDQFIQTSLMRVAKFRCSEGKIRGQFIQGTSFNTAEGFDKRINEVPEVFQSVKAAERFFVNPVSDPYFQTFMRSWDQGVRHQEIDL